MALRYTFKPGPQQALQASHYFKRLAGDLVEEHMDQLMPKQVQLFEHERQRLPLRIWTTQQDVTSQVLDLVPWLYNVIRATHNASHEPRNDGKLKELVQDLLGAQLAPETLFIEVLDPAHAFTADEDNDLAIAIVGGEVVMLSTRNLIYMQLAADTFGLAVAPTGSYLVERILDARPQHQSRCA